MCGKPYGRRKRCYFCNGRKRTGEMRKCPVCSGEFYAPGWAIRDVARNSGTYCSRTCKGKVEAERERVWFKRGEVTRHSAGYLLEWAPNHPRSTGGRVLQHILVAEAMLGRRLRRDEHVHHRNLVRDDNRPENLIVLNAREHHQLHSALMRQKRQSKVTGL
jgi:hypothetical protein